MKGDEMATAVEAPTRRRGRPKKEQEGSGLESQPTGKRSKKTEPQRAQRTQRKTDDAELDVEVDFLGVSLGAETARLGCKVARSRIPLGAAELVLCGRRLSGRVTVRPDGDDADQTYIVDGMKHEISAVFDVKRFSVSPDWLSFGLTFVMTEIDVRELACFAKRRGQLVVAEVTDITNDGGESDG